MNTAYQRALLLVALGRYIDAEISLRHSLAQNPDDARAYAMLAVCLAAQSKFKEARDDADAAIAKDPELSFGYYALAVTLLRDTHFASNHETTIDSEVVTSALSRLELAEQNIRVAIRIDPENANYHALLAAVLLDRGDGEQALDEARLALLFEPEQADALKIIPVAAGYLGIADKEVSTSVTAITSSPEGAIEQAIYGAAFLRTGQRARALPLFDSALEREPDHPFVRRQYLEGARSASRIHALAVRTRHQSKLVANPYAAVYSVALTLFVGIGFALAVILAQKMHVQDSRELIILAGFMLPAYALMTLRAWIDFRLQFDPQAGPLLSRSERWQANGAVWFGATLLAVQAIPVATTFGHSMIGLWIFAVLELAATIYFTARARSRN